MAAHTFRPDPKRDAAAQEIAEGAGQWLKVTVRETVGAFTAGMRFYGVPSASTPGVYYLTNFVYCSCPDYATRASGCKHQRAVALYVLRVHRERRSREQQDGAASVAPTPTVLNDPDGSRTYLARLEAEQVTQTAHLTALRLDPLHDPVWAERDQWITRLRARHTIQDRDARTRTVAPEQRRERGRAILAGWRAD
jgi:hypothetical protein